MNGLLQWVSICAVMLVGDGAIEPPPWSDPSKNPCANRPNGWQLLYWPPLKQCFKIYTVPFSFFGAFFPRFTSFFCFDVLFSSVIHALIQWN